MPRTTPFEDHAVDCAEARARILASSIDDEVREHVSGCAPCAELADDDGRLGHLLGASRRAPTRPEGLAAVLTSTREEDADPLGRLRALPTSRRLAIGSASAVIGAVVCFLAWRRPDWGVYPMMRMGLVVTAMVIATVFGVALSMPRIYKPEQARSLRLGLFCFLLAIPFVPALLPLAHEAHPVSIAPQSFWLAIGKCLGFGTLAAFPALLAIRALQRDTTLTVWGAVFAALAAAVGANIALQLHCPIVDPMHIVVGHAFMGVIYAALAWAVVRVTVKGDSSG